jgi:hypothetical protein
MNTYERAIQIYQVLIAAAHNRQLLTYQILGQQIGVPGRGLGSHLGHILRYCERRGLPRLTSLCVSKDDGVPSHGYTKLIPRTPAELHRDREKVYAHKWYRDRPVTVADLEGQDTR